MMIYVQISNGVVSFVHTKPEMLNKTNEELLQNGFFVESIPEPEQIEGKISVLKYNGTNLYYDYVDAPVDEMTTLKNKVELQEQALAELTMYISTLVV